MLRISKLTDYSTIVLSHVASRHEELCSANDISQDTKIALPTVSKLLKILTNKGFLTSQRGSKGGYQLARAADQITVVEIVSAIEGGIALTQCSVSDSCLSEACSLESDCNVKENWRIINRIIISALERVSLTDLMSQRSPLRAIHQKVGELDDC